MNLEQNGTPVIVYYHVGGNGLRKGLLLLHWWWWLRRKEDRRWEGRVSAVVYASDKKKWRKRKKREKEYERDMTESLRLLRVSRAPAGDLVCSNKETLRQVSETHQSYKSNTVIGQS